MDIEKAIREYLPSVIHMSLATCVDNRPWVCEVHFAYDEDLNLYWRSKENRRHSQEIAQNPRVAGNIVKQFGPEDKTVFGVYFEGVAEKLEGVQVGDTVYQLFADRFGMGPEIVDSAARKDGNVFYRVAVSDMYVFGSIDNRPMQKYHLEWRGDDT